VFKIREAREKAGITQQKLADKLGTTREYISKIENEHKNPSIDMLNKIAKELNTTLKNLIEEPA
jgi:transcriptional regulator with XRE-family HTH domain